MIASTMTCPRCGHTARPLDWRCTACEAPLEIAHLPAFNADAINTAEWSLWRYAAMLPAEPRFTLQAGMTPLLDLQLGDISVKVKGDHLNPTGSYKDRGTEVMLNHLVAHGAREVVEDSSGNAGASVALYAARAGIHARIFTPANAAGNKKRQIETAAALVPVGGVRQNVTDAVIEAAQAPNITYATHAWNPYFIAGQMTGAWEVWEQLGRRAPEAVACPVGMGCLMLGWVRGFAQLLAAGLIDRMPRFFAVQAAASDPIVQAWEQGLDDVPAITTQPTVADGIVIAKPVRSTEIIAALHQTHGAAIRVQEADILPMRDRLAREHGVLIEPTSATTLAALPQIRQHYSGDDLVVILTGNGLKTL